MEKKFRTRMAFWLNVLLAVLEIIGLGLSLKYTGIKMVCFYTQDSNILALLGCLPIIIAFLRRTELPQWAQYLKYTSVCCLTITCLVVLFVLVPMGTEGSAKDLLLDGPMLYMHLLCPLTALVNFAFFEDMPALHKADVARAMIPTVLYALVMIVLNLVHVVDGPYPFLRVYEQSLIMSFVWAIIIIGGAGLIALAVYALHRRLPR